MANRKDPAAAALVKLFADHLGQSLRNAQIHKARNSPEWQRFTGTFGAVKPKANALLDSAPTNPDDVIPPPPAENESGPAEMHRQHLAVWRGTHADWENAGDPLVKASIALTLVKVREAFVKAKRDHEDHEQRQRVTIHFSELQATREKFWLPLRDLLRNMPAEVSAMCDPAYRAEVRRICGEFLVERLQPQINRLLDDLEGYGLTPQ